nr:hypothetical protein [Caballeronia sp. LZ025]
MFRRLRAAQRKRLPAFRVPCGIIPLARTPKPPMARFVALCAAQGRLIGVSGARLFDQRKEARAAQARLAGPQAIERQRGERRAPAGGVARERTASERRAASCADERAVDSRFACGFDVRHDDVLMTARNITDDCTPDAVPESVAASPENHPVALRQSCTIRRV